MVNASRRAEHRSCCVSIIRLGFATRALLQLASSELHRPKHMAKAPKRRKSSTQGPPSTERNQDSGRRLQDFDFESILEHLETELREFVEDEERRKQGTKRNRLN
jgi:hypothetical protein